VEKLAFVSMASHGTVSVKSYGFTSPVFYVHNLQKQTNVVGSFQGAELLLSLALRCVLAEQFRANYSLFV
jgi:hypothetical protein